MKKPSPPSLKKIPAPVPVQEATLLDLPDEHRGDPETAGEIKKSPLSAIYGVVDMITEMNKAVFKVDKGSKPVIHLDHEAGKRQEEEQHKRPAAMPDKHDQARRLTGTSDQHPPSMTSERQRRPASAGPAAFALDPVMIGEQQAQEMVDHNNRQQDRAR